MGNIYKKAPEEIALIMHENQVKQQDSYIIKNRGYITASKLKAFKESPENFFLKYILEMPGKSTETKSLKLGNAVDYYISYGEEKFNETYFVPVKKMLKADWLLECTKNLLKEDPKITQEEIDAKLSAFKAEELKAMALMGKIVLTDTEAGQVLGMINEYKRQPLFNFNGKYKKQEELEYEYKGLKLKATLDRIGYDEQEGELRDMKTSGDIKKFNFAAIDYGYDFSMSFYNILATLLNEIPYTLILDVVASNAPYASQCIKIPAETVVGQGKTQIIPQLNKLAAMMKEWNETKDAKVWIKGALEDIQNDTMDAKRENLFGCEMYAEMETTIQKHFTYLQ